MLGSARDGALRAHATLPGRLRKRVRTVKHPAARGSRYDALVQLCGGGTRVVQPQRRVSVQCLLRAHQVERGHRRRRRLTLLHDAHLVTPPNGFSSSQVHRTVKDAA